MRVSETGWNVPLALALALVGLGCFREPEHDPDAPAQKPAAEHEDPAVAAGSAPRFVTLRGNLVWGHEVRSFTECSSTEGLWFVDETGGEVRAIHEALASEAYQALFFEIRGRRGPKLEEGFAADYPGSVTVTEVRRAEREGWGCREDFDALEFRAFGVEPFWGLEIAPGGLTLKRPEIAAGAVWPREPPDRDGASRIYHSEDENGRTVAIELVEERCIDPMSGAHFAFSAEVRLADETLRGCAVEGDLSR